MAQDTTDAAVAAQNQSALILATGANPDAVLPFDPVHIVTLVGTLAGALAAAVAGGPVTLAGFSIAQLTGLAAGVAAEVPAAIEAFNEIKALVDGGQAPTPEQWAKWNAAADAATAAARAAEDAVISGAAPAQPAAGG